MNDVITLYLVKFDAPLASNGNKLYRTLDTAIEKFKECREQWPNLSGELSQIDIPVGAMDLSDLLVCLYVGQLPYGCEGVPLALWDTAETKWFSYGVEYDNYLSVRITMADHPLLNEERVVRASQVAERYPKMREFILNDDFVSLNWAVGTEEISIEFSSEDDDPKFFSNEVTEGYYDRKDEVIPL